MKIEWKGGKCPVSPETMVKVWFSDGQIAKCYPAHCYYWMKTGNSTDIIAYEVIENEYKSIMESEKTLRDELAMAYIASGKLNLANSGEEAYFMADQAMKAREK